MRNLGYPFSQGIYSCDLKPALLSELNIIIRSSHYLTSTTRLNPNYQRYKYEDENARKCPFFSHVKFPARARSFPKNNFFYIVPPYPRLPRLGRDGPLVGQFHTLMIFSRLYMQSTFFVNIDESKCFGKSPVVTVKAPPRSP